jgi:hypothetical protein
MSPENAAVLIVIVCEVLQTLLIAAGIVQIARINSELGHLTHRQTFLETVVGSQDGSRGPAQGFGPGGVPGGRVLGPHTRPVG